MSTAGLGYQLDYSWDHPWPRAPIPANEADRLEDLRKYKILDTPQEEKYNKLCRIACKEMKCPIAAVSFIDKQRQWFKANSGLTQAAIPRDVALCAHTIMNPRGVVVVGDTTQDERFKNNPLVTRASSVKFYAGVPLVTPAGYCIGTVFVFDVKTHASCDTKLLQKIAAKVMKYLDERLRGVDGAAPAPAAPAAPSPAKPQQPVPAAEPSKPVAPPATAVVKAAPPSQPVPEPQPEPVYKPAATTPAPVRVPPQPQSVPQPQLPTTTADAGTAFVSAPMSAPAAGASAALVPAGAPMATSERSLATAVNQEGQMTNMGAMLMNLLARTTETQQQLAAQQGVMFETLGHHSEQLNSLTETISSLEMRIDRSAKARKLAGKN